VITRDVGIVLTVTVVNLAVGPRTFRPSTFGKAATGTYILTVTMVLFFNYLGRHSAVVDLAVWASLAATLVSGLHYVAHARRIINEPPASS
jgi:phosphatidylglycerophosphate synthase